ncbi:hypothetical protein JF780_05775 [Mycobacterium intracellulare]|uniref:hypothetical protein n=1 Tax=Mycobacterium intracellulare TaxID=1767 RepID=UPI001928E3DA|nr:hypothetical protein [Mycobacterium intracellulare]MCA2275500.1 hypothetical protein [Mycobacterium intracellulare]MCA2324460.1 hypothetical protein [Mycobacterium intracellulare]BCP29603.1 hypothetical protein MINTM026_05730 [Mycobacterium intracellulare]
MSAGYQVVAPLVVAKDQTGKLHHCYRGAWIPWLDDVQKAHFLRHGLVKQLESPDAAAPIEPLDSLVEKPKKVAPKEDWVRFGVSKGNNQAELEALTKDELVDLLGDF